MTRSCYAPSLNVASLRRRTRYPVLAWSRIWDAGCSWESRVTTYVFDDSKFGNTMRASNVIAELLTRAATVAVGVFQRPNYVHQVCYTADLPGGRS
mgnify:CR=1 FL=1